ncbi:MAG: biopolymer transporter ExbD [Rhodobacteraceae bacterium]|nr:biopolymer transporter ExbD [Paracoccaceae bacterium]
MKIARRQRNTALITLTPLVDVMLILLVFFMVTSTYLDLDMMPMVERGENPDQIAPNSGTDGATTLLIQVNANGEARLRGQTLTPAALSEALRANPDARVLILPSGFADVQSLVSVIEAATAAGVTNLRVVRLEAAE